MQRFYAFIETLNLHEAKLAGSGLNGERHAKKYLIPDTSTTTHIAHNDIKAGDDVHILGHHIDEKGRVHAHIRHNGAEKTIPASKLNKPSSSRAVKYNDEQATVKMWNHANKDGSHGNINKLHSEVEAAKNNPKHPLSFENASSDGFEGGNKHEGAKEDYYRKLHKTAHSIVAMSNSNDKIIKDHIKKRSTAYVQGAEKGNLSPIYRQHYGDKPRGAAGTSKADIRLGERGDHGAGFISVKDETGGQISSGGSQEFKAIHHAAASEMLNNHSAYKHLSDAEKAKHNARIMDHVTKISNIMHDSSKIRSEDGIKFRISAGSKIHDKLHKEYPHLWHEVRREAMTGRQKFEPNSNGSSSANVATHIIRHSKIGKNNTVLRPAEVTNIDDIDHGAKKKGMFAKGKTGIGNNLSYRIAG